MKNTFSLPEGFQHAFTLDLQKNKKQALLVNGLALLIGVLLWLVSFPLMVSSLTASWRTGGMWFLQLMVFSISILAYLPLHELVHGLFIRRYSGKRAHYGLTWLYAYAGSKAFFCKQDYFIIALSPVVFWGVVFALLAFVLPLPWFWVAYGLEIVNLSGAAGDLYVIGRLCRLPSSLLVQDSGLSMDIYLPAPSGASKPEADL